MNELAPTQDRLATLDALDEVTLSDYADRMLGCSALAACGEERAYSVKTRQEIVMARAARLAASLQSAESID